MKLDLSLEELEILTIALDENLDAIYEYCENMDSKAEELSKKVHKAYEEEKEHEN